MYHALDPVILLMMVAVWILQGLDLEYRKKHNIFYFSSDFGILILKDKFYKTRYSVRSLSLLPLKT